MGRLEGAGWAGGVWGGRVVGLGGRGRGFGGRFLRLRVSWWMGVGLGLRRGG